MKTETIENRPFAAIVVGDSAELTRTLTKEDIELFAAASGDFNPTHVDEGYAREHHLGPLTAHSMWGGALFSSVLGNLLPGPGTVYRSQTLRFHRPIQLGDIVTVRVTAKEKRADRVVMFDCQCLSHTGEVVITGTAEVIAPAEKIVRSQVDLPGFEQHHHGVFEKLIAHGDKLAPCPAAIAHPCDESALRAAVEAGKAGFIVPVLVGPRAKIQAVADEHELDIIAVINWVQYNIRSA